MSDPSAIVADGSGAMFDRIADRYDLNRISSLGIDNGWRRKTTEALKLDGIAAPHVLDLATGTGDLAIATARRYPNATILGTDPSRGMIKIGDEKLAKLGLASRVTLAVGDAQAIEADDASFDAVTISFGIRNVPDRDRALREMRRHRCDSRTGRAPSRNSRPTRAISRSSRRAAPRRMALRRERVSLPAAVDCSLPRA